MNTIINNIYEKMEKELEEKYIKRNKKQNKTSKKPNNDFTTKIFNHSNYSIKVNPKEKKYEYLLYDRDELIDTYTGEITPSECNETTKFIILFSKKISKDSDFKESSINRRLRLALKKIQEQIDDYEEHKEEYLTQEKEESLNERINEIKPRYEELVDLINKSDYTLIDYTQVCITYLINGENENVLKGLTCHLSTYFGLMSIWFIVVGKAGEGKSTIEQASIKLLPYEAFMNGRITSNALHRATLEYGNDFVNGMIMRLGDFGGEKDLQNRDNIEMLNSYKELTTEGKLEKVITSDSKDATSGERGTVKLTVEGHCSASFTTVKSEEIDEQYSSRGFTVVPVSTNAQVRSYVSNNVGAYNDKVNLIIHEKIGLLKDYIEYIKYNYADTPVFNPYIECVYDGLEDEEYFKRNLIKFKNLIDTVTIFNYPFREKITNSDGKTYLISTRADNKLVTDLFFGNFGISPLAAKLYNKIFEWFYVSETGVDKESAEVVYGKCEDSEDYINLCDKELVMYSDDTGSNIKDYNTIFSFSIIKTKALKNKDFNGLEVDKLISSLINKGFIKNTNVKLNKGRGNVYCLGRYEPLVAHEINFDDDCVEKYLSVQAPELFKINFSQEDAPWSSGGYTRGGIFLEKSNIETVEKLRECFFDDLGVARWF